MAEVIISKIKIRRGLNSQRKTLVYDQGEPIFTTDNKRLYIGTGTLLGGVVVGSKNHTPLMNESSLTSTVAEIGDLVNANNKFWQLTASDYTNADSWADVSTKIDPTLFAYTPANKITLKIDAFQGDSSLNPSGPGWSSIFDGSATGTYVGGGSPTTFTALSSDGVTPVNLSSAGFIVFEGNNTTIQGATLQRFAIPIFTY